MSSRKTTVFYGLLIAVASLAVGMVLASRLDLAPQSSAQTVAAPRGNSAPLSGPVTATTFRDIAKNVSPAVVNIRTETRQRTQDLNEFFGGGGGGDDLLERFFGGGQGQGQGQGRQGQPGQQRPREQVVQAAGTGFIIDKAGLILTNNHVVEGAQKIEVSLFGEDEGREYAARVVGRDPLTDSALIELTEKPTQVLPEVKFGDSAQMQPGDWVMAIGNPFGLAHTVSVGVISASARSFPVAQQRFAQVLQTDAAINPGNSGGPLLNVRGEVIGINTAIYSDARAQGNIGIGFAMPINTVLDLLPQLRTGKITRGRIGVAIGPVQANAVEAFGLKDRNGAVVSSVVPDSAADKAGIEPGDVILNFNSRPIRKSDELVAMVTATRPGTTVPVRIIRDRQERTLNITVDELDLETETQQAAQNDSRAPEVQPETTRGFGMSLGNVTPQMAQRQRIEARGALIMTVEPDGAAARAGLAPGDVILRVGQVTVATAAEAQRALERVPSGSPAFLRVLRNGQEQFIAVTKD